MGYAKGRATRLDIIEQATALFGEAGYRGTSLREIAGRCGLSHPGLLHHFPTKQSLLLAVLEHRDEADHRAAGAVTGVEALRTMVDLAARNTRRRGIVELFTVLSAEATASDHPAHEFFVARYRRVVRELQQAYAEAAAAGHLRSSVVPLEAARELVALMDGLQIQWLLSDGTLDMAAALGRHLEAQLTAPPA